MTMLTRLINAIRAAFRAALSRLANRIKAARGGGQGEE